jgi:hypothetical protein
MQGTLAKWRRIGEENYTRGQSLAEIARGWLSIVLERHPEASRLGYAQGAEDASHDSSRRLRQ